MVFENVTALELHLHTGEEDPLPSETPRERRTTESEPPERSSRRVSPKTMAIVMAVVSITISLVVTLLVRKFRTKDDADDEDI